MVLAPPVLQELENSQAEAYCWSWPAELLNFNEDGNERAYCLSSSHSRSYEGGFITEDKITSRSLKLGMKMQSSSNRL